MPSQPPQRVQKCRGATLNPEGRFATRSRTLDDDGWDALEEPLPPLETTVLAESARTVISRNDSPDIPFRQSINPYRGCEHGCPYCLGGDTPILYADGRHRPLKDVRAGDVLVGTVRRGWYRRYAESRVLDHWSTLKPAYRIELADGTTLLAGGDHRFLTERGWKFVTGKEQGAGRRPHLTRNNSLMGVGGFSAPPEDTDDYRRGYLSGLIRGDGTIGRYHYPHHRGGGVHLYLFRLALVDEEALLRARSYLSDYGVHTFLFEFQKAVGTSTGMRAIRTNARAEVQRIEEMIRWPQAPSDSWRKGFLAGTFDAEGHFGDGCVIRIFNTNPTVITWIREALIHFGFPHVLEQAATGRAKPLSIVRLTGGLAKQLRFLHATDPAIARKRSIIGLALKSDVDLRVTSIEPMPGAMRLYDITTSTHDFIANGVVSHNCYARPSHAYVDLSPGLDFETRLFYKRNAAARLTEELRKPGYRCSPITLGANTDPYQPIEREHRVTRSILEVLRDFRHPLTIVTKSALVVRDLDLLRELAADHLVQVMISITSLSADIKRTLEPRAAGPAARLKAVRALSDAGVPAGVMVAPIIPAITDHEIERIVEAAAAAGAVDAGYVLLRLPYEVKDLFRAWLDAHYPQRAAHVMSLVQQMRGGRDNDPRFGTRMRGQGPYAELIGRRFRAACRRHGLPRAETGRLNTDLFRAPPRAGDQLTLL